MNSGANHRVTWTGPEKLPPYPACNSRHMGMGGTRSATCPETLTAATNLLPIQNSARTTTPVQKCSDGRTGKPARGLGELARRDRTWLPRLADPEQLRASSVCGQLPMLLLTVSFCSDDDHGWHLAMAWRERSGNPGGKGTGPAGHGWMDGWGAESRFPRIELRAATNAGQTKRCGQIIAGWIRRKGRGT